MKQSVYFKHRFALLLVLEPISVLSAGRHPVFFVFLSLSPAAAQIYERTAPPVRHTLYNMQMHRRGPN